MVRAKRSGFVMIDLITAMAIVSFGFCGIFTLLSRELVDIRNLYYTDIAMMSAEAEVDILRSLDFYELKDCTKGPLVGNPGMFASLDEGKGSLDIESYPGSDGKIKKATVNLSWRPARGGRREIKLTTLIYGMSSGKQ
jgi:hypothetical protein